MHASKSSHDIRARPVCGSYDKIYEPEIDQQSKTGSFFYMLSEQHVLCGLDGKKGHCKHEESGRAGINSSTEHMKEKFPGRHERLLL